MKKEILSCVQIYQKELEKGDIQEAYRFLTRYMAKLKAQFPSDYTTGNLAYGYLDYTYFYFTDAFLKARKLKFALVLNHAGMRFELWLLGQTSDIQKQYWSRMRGTKWVKGQDRMPQYYILEVCLESGLHFIEEDSVKESIVAAAMEAAKEIQAYLECAE